MKTQTFNATGTVLGRNWGGGNGAYPARKISAETKQELMDKANEMLSDGSLDSGMGFEKLIGARLYIQAITTVEIDGKLFTNTQTDAENIGQLTEDEEDFLIECHYNQ
jgi:hypothetical protein